MIQQLIIRINEGWFTYQHTFVKFYNVKLFRQLFIKMLQGFYYMYIT